MSLLICGHQRSGTTLLSHVLGYHPEVQLTVEFGNFLGVGLSRGEYVRFLLDRWWVLKRRNNLLIPFKLRRLNFLRNHVFIPRYLLAYSRYGVQPVTAASIESSLRHIFPHAKVVGDKFPDYLFHLRQLTAAGEVEPLVIYRDCRDVASSTLRQARTKWRDAEWVKWLDTPEKVAQRWVWAIQIMEQNADRIHIVRYEDLVTNPNPVLRAIGTWLGVEPSGFSPRRIATDKIGKYRSGLNPEELKTVIDVAGPTMERLGYRL